MTTRFPYVFKKKIGKGGYGNIYRIEHQETGKHYACKVTQTSKTNETNFMLKLNGHNNIIKFHESYTFNNKNLIIMEECSGPNILESIVQEKNMNRRHELRELYILQCIDAIKHCHDNGIIHRDIKHNNFLLKSQDQYPTVKLIDFGLSEYDFGFISTEIKGTLQYIPPEAFTLKPINNFHTSIQSKNYDIWSLGIMIYMLYAGENMFYANDEKTIVKYIRTRKINNSMKNIKDYRLNRMIYQMLNISPMMRPDIDEVKENYLQFIR